MASTCSLQQHGRAPASINLHHKQQRSCSPRISVMVGNRNVMLLQGFIYNNNVSKRRPTAGLVVKCSGIGLGDFIGGDLVKFDIGQWLSDVEEHKALAIYPPHEGGYEGRYLNRLIRQGYYFLDLSARGLGDPETTLTKVHPVCPVSNYALDALPPSINIHFMIAYAFGECINFRHI